MGPPHILHGPMRDGVVLHTELHLPAILPAPLILIRTPYPQERIPYASRPIGRFVPSGYALATQACRGTGASRGRRFFHNEVSDGHDAIKWLTAADRWPALQMLSSRCGSLIRHPASTAGVL